MDKKNLLIRILVVASVVLITAILVVWKLKFDKPQAVKNSDVNIPSIVGGELVLPKVDLKLDRQDQLSSGQALLEDQIWVMSANLVGIFAAPPGGASQAATLKGIRVLGEMYNPGKKAINNFLPVIRFLDNENNLKTQKIAHYSQNYEFYSLDSQQRGGYDITVDDPPMSDKIEVVLKPQEGDKNLRLPVALKVASRSSEIQVVQGYDTYLVKGEVVNTTDSSVADILVNAYVKDKDGKVFGFAKQDFKADLIRPGETIPFKILVLPVKTDVVYDETVIEVWGREYRF